MKTRTGKIARLPKPIREQLNQRLENGELGTTLIPWLNEQPEVQKMITEEFAGHPIRQQNLSQWRQGGYRDWTRHQLLREQTRWVSEQSAELCSDCGPDTITIAEDVANIMSAELAMHVQALGEITDPKKRFEQFRYLCRELSRLRRDDQRAIRTIHRREQWEYDHPQRPAAGGAPPSARTVLASRPYIPTPEELNRLRLAALYSQQAGIPLTPESGKEANNSKPYIPSIAELQRLRDVALNRNAANPQTPETSASQPAPTPTIPGPDSIPTEGGQSPSSSFYILPSALPEPAEPKPEIIAEQPPLPPQLTTPTHPNPPIPSQNNSHSKPDLSAIALAKAETQNSKLETMAAPAITPNRPFNPHRDYYDPRPPIRGRRPRYLEG